MAIRLLILLMAFCVATNAQITVKDAKRTAETRINKDLNKGVNAGIDKIEKGIGNIFSGKNKKNNSQAQPNTAEQNTNNTSQTTSTENTQQSDEVTRKFDFVQGEKVLVIEDFGRDSLGDFPARWTTNSGGEIVKLNGEAQNWFNLGKVGVFMPKFISSLPSNFTFEFDVTCSQNFNFYSNSLNFAIAELVNPSKDYVKWKQFNRLGRNGIEIGIHPNDGFFKKGTTNYQIYENGNFGLKNKATQNQFVANLNPVVHVSIWRQKNRLRVYLNQEKVWDLPDAFIESKKYNSILFQTGNFKKEDDKYYISNLRLAVGNPDTRNKFLNEGKFVSSGILFNVASANIKSESFGVIKSIANILQENTSLNIKIIGHTDADGDEKANLTLSKQRAEAIKNAIVTDFGIAASRIKTDGKGELIPLMPNTTIENKANNRRVEFIKL